jgi:hypothetical protein
MQTSSHQSHQPNFEPNYFNLNPYEDSHSGAAILHSTPFKQPLAPTQPTELPDPTFSDISDIGITLENPWIDGCKFHL